MPSEGRRRKGEAPTPKTVVIQGQRDGAEISFDVQANGSIGSM